MNRASIVAPVLGALLFGCGSTTFTATGPRFPPREPNCDYAVFVSEVPDPYIELGLIEVIEGMNTSHFGELGPFVEYIRPYVCEAGGYGAIIDLDEEVGRYLEATVIRKAMPPQQTVQNAEPIPPATPPLTSPPPAAPPVAKSVAPNEADNWARGAIGFGFFFVPLIQSLG